MGLIAFSAILSIILGACAWLALGDRLPAGSEDKWPTAWNILCYAAIIVGPLYLTIFFTF